MRVEGPLNLLMVALFKSTSHLPTSLTSIVLLLRHAVTSEQQLFIEQIDSY